jgi:hypothetical protein
LYHRQYWYRLLDSFAEDFPALRRLLGEKCFWQLAEAYLEATPSRSYTLRHLGKDLADFITQSSGLTDRMSVHATELARLEYALCLTFEASEAQPLPAAELDRAQVSLQPHIQLFALRTNAPKLWQRAIDNLAIARTRLAPPATGPVHFVAVFRHQWRPQMEALEPDAYRLLHAIQRGRRLDDALEESALSTTPESLAKIQSWFAHWTTRGWLTRTDLLTTTP